ncbi:hypothetical protein [Kitasatospora sp. CB01950]|nr:hypothetical protein [Kitasatospora sp. CB01950]
MAERLVARQELPASGQSAACAHLLREVRVLFGAHTEAAGVRIRDGATA